MAGDPSFVIHKHAASSLHYDLRLEAAGAKPQWLLVKRGDEGADARRDPVSTQPESVRGRRTIEDLANGRDR